MSALSSSAISSSKAASTRPLRLGFLPLTDAAPLIVAQERGFFAREDLRAELRREIGWATILDKIIYGELDAAQAPAPMLWSAQLGLGCPNCDVLTALVLNLNGNALTLSRALWDAGVRDQASLRAHALVRRSRQPLTFGMVFPYSSHHLQLRDWLNGAGLVPGRDVRLVVVPPAQMFRNLKAGTIDGFCAGEPWNTLAVRDGAGWCPTSGAALQPGQVDTVLMVTRRFATSRPAEHAALVRALAAAAVWCDEPQHRKPLAELIATAPFLNLPAEVIAPALVGRFNCGHDRTEPAPDFHVFHRGDASVPAVEKAKALQRALGSAGLLSPQAAADPKLPRRLFREDLHRAFLTSNPPRQEIAIASDLREVGSHAG